MPFTVQTALRLLLGAVLFTAPSIAASPGDLPQRDAAVQQTSVTKQQLTLAELKATGLVRSRFKDLPGGGELHPKSNAGGEAPQADLAQFESTIKPLLIQHCVDCHGPETAEGNIRIDTLDPDLVSGADSDWWSEIFAVVTKGEMPPPDQSELQEDERQQLVDWLSTELQTASIVRRQSGNHSTFRRMTRYEYNYALQDLLGLPWDFAKDLPPEAHSDEGFENRSDLLHLSVSQFETFHRIAYSALKRATVQGDQPPTRYWTIPMQDAAEREWAKQAQQLTKLEQELKDDPTKLAAERERLENTFRVPPRGAYYKELSSGRAAKAEWEYYNAKYAFAAQDQPADLPDRHDCIAILPSGPGSRLIIELGDQLPDEGTMRVTVQASRYDNQDDRLASLQLLFGWQATNEGRALLRVNQDDTLVTATPDRPQLIQWDVELGEIYPRNSVRKTWPMGAIPSPSEYIRLANSSASPCEIQIDYVQVAAPVYDQWPPESHRRIFGDRRGTDEPAEAREIIAAFMTRAWRRPLHDAEVDRKLAQFVAIRPQCDSFEEAVIEVLATVLSSPQFLYVTNSASAESSGDTAERERLDQYALANRLALFLWCSIPDEELLRLAERGELVDEGLAAQVQRMLDDPRSQRFASHFVHQWLDLQLLEFLNFQQHIRNFDPLLKEAMLYEPVGMFSEMLRENASMLDLIHADYAMVNERLARHYGLAGVYGNHFRRVALDGGYRRGGLLTQAGMLAMNSDWPDSHPLKRAIWLLESILGDPPPPPPPAVPQIDLADPEIAKMTLKERIEDHRNHAACISCHSKIDPWGIAFENYDALGQWRDEVGGKPVDATSELFNHQTLDGMEGLKRYLLEHRQDQLVHALVSKLTTYALGRPLTFADRAEIEAMTAQVRREGDGLRTAIEAIISSELFGSR